MTSSVRRALHLIPGHLPTKFGGHPTYRLGEDRDTFVYTHSHSAKHTFDLNSLGSLRLTRTAVLPKFPSINYRNRVDALQHHTIVCFELSKSSVNGKFSQKVPQYTEKPVIISLTSTSHSQHS